MFFFQDKFDHDKGQKSAISGRRLHWRLSTGFFCFFSSIYVQFSKTSPLESGESSEKSRGENRVKSCHVCGCHGYFGPDFCICRGESVSTVVWLATGMFATETRGDVRLRLLLLSEVNATPQQSEISLNFSVFHTFLA